jgi:hypothetical protein
MTFDDCSICSLFYGFADRTANFVDVFMTFRPRQFGYEMLSQLLPIKMLNSVFDGVSHGEIVHLIQKQRFQRFWFLIKKLL